MFTSLSSHLKLIFLTIVVWLTLSLNGLIVKTLSNLLNFKVMAGCTMLWFHYLKQSNDNVCIGGRKDKRSLKQNCAIIQT